LHRKAMKACPGDLAPCVSGRTEPGREGRLDAGPKSADGIVGHDVAKLVVRHSKAERPEAKDRAERAKRWPERPGRLRVGGGPG